MNACLRISLLSVAGWLCLAAGAFAQAEPEENLNLVVSNDLLVPPGKYHGNDMVFRNQVGGVCFSARADMVVLDRLGNKSFTLLQNGQGGTEALNNRDLNFEMRTGPKLSLIIDQILFGCDLELGYEGIDGFSVTSSTLNDAAPLFFESPLMSTDASLADGIRFKYTSRIHSAEANLRLGIGNRLWLLGGFRYVDLHEQIEGSFITAGQSDTRFITANTDNHLYGFQLGGELAIINLQKITISGVAKAGIFSNQADLNLYDDNQGVGGIKGQLAFLGEVDLVGSYWITDNIGLRLGYQAMWVQGVALASDQLQMPSQLGPPGWNPDTRGALFYHGAFLGLEISF